MPPAPKTYHKKSFPFSPFADDDSAPTTNSTRTGKKTQCKANINPQGPGKKKKRTKNNKIKFSPRFFFFFLHHTLSPGKSSTLSNAHRQGQYPGQMQGLKGFKIKSGTWFAMKRLGPFDLSGVGLSPLGCLDLFFRGPPRVVFICASNFFFMNFIAESPGSGRMGAIGALVYFQVFPSEAVGARGDGALYHVPTGSDQSCTDFSKREVYCPYL